MSSAQQIERTPGASGSASDAPTEPRRLVDDSGELGTLLERAERGFAASLDEPRAWARLSCRWSYRYPLFVSLGRAAAAGLAVAATVWLVLGVLIDSPRASDTGSGRSPEHAVRLDSSGTDARHVALGPSDVALTGGRYELSGGVKVDLAKQSGARAARSQLGTRIALDRGAIELAVHQQPRSHTLEVVAGGYRFVVIGTEFSVNLKESAVALDVRHGRVAVWQGDRTLSRVGAGEHWQAERQDVRASDTRAQTLPNAGPSAPGATGQGASTQGVVATQQDCLAQARQGEPRQAERCFEAQARGSSLGAEVALYELGRLRADVLGDLSGALSALSEHRRRFPQGTLTSEAELARLDVLMGLGRRDEVLEQSERLLSSGVGAERVLELRLLRGRLYRAQGDLGRAEREYAAASRSPTLGGAEASFERARCLDSLGRLSEATAEYQRYLGRNQGRHRKQAEQRLEELSE